MSLGKKVVAETVSGEPVHIRTLNAGKQAVKVIELMQKVGKEPHLFPEIGALLVCLCHCDQDGNRTYQDDQLDSIREEASLGFLKEFTEKALTVSGLGEDAEDLKNSAADQ